MLSFHQFAEDFRAVADPREIRVLTGSLKYQHNDLSLHGPVEGSIYVRQSPALYWQVSKGAVKAIERRRRHQLGPSAIVLLHQTNQAGYVLSEEVVLTQADEWADSSERQYGLNGEDVEHGFRFESLEELMGILRVLFSGSVEG